MIAAAWVLIVALPLAAGQSFGQARMASEADFISAKECGHCHQEIYNQWAQSMHSRSATDPVYRAVVGEMMRETAGLHKPFCLSCHAPVASALGKFQDLSKPVDWEGLSEVEAQGVTCDFCHTIAAGGNVGRNISVGPYVYPRKGPTPVKYGRHGDARSDNHEVETSRFLTSSEFCALCHRLKHPVAGREIQNTYEEWLQGPYRQQQIRCQDCHMPAYGGSTATGGKHRDEIHAHAFLGGHSEMIRKAATLTVWGSQEKRRDGSRLTVTTSVTNSGAGHSIPTGLPGMRAMSLQVEVFGPQGERLQQRRFRYGQRLVRRDGSDALPWEAYRNLEDNRIAPRESRQDRFSVTVPARIRGAVRVRATLSMELISEAMARRLKMTPPEPLLMTTAESAIPLD
ncbi:MAG: hypothetical protein HYX74_10565 [Acidobacteria bacterium]|nr:hypothetical protein [Acidobacteriota bacterium]